MGNPELVRKIIKMLRLIVIAALIAAAMATAESNPKVARLIPLNPPACSANQLAACAGEITAAVGDCILSFDILGCVNDVLAASDCLDCVCDVLASLGLNLC